MVLVDTSVWIGLFRKRSASAAQRVVQLAKDDLAAVCGPIWVEFLRGFRSRETRREYAKLLNDYRWLGTPREAFELASDWAAAYPQLGALDAVIGATAMVHRASLLTLDRDFMRLRPEGLRVEWVTL